MRPLLLCSLLLSLVARAEAPDVPLLLPVQSRLLDGADLPVSGPLQITFSLHRHASPPPEGSGQSDEALWSEAHAVQVTQGVFSVVLGAQEALDPGVLSGERFLGISIDGQPLLPRMRIGAVPFAINARTAGVAFALDCEGCIETGQLGDGQVTLAKLAEMGDGSGLDADLLDGVEASAFALRTDLEPLLTKTGDGSALTGVNAETLENRSADSFADASHAHAIADIAGFPEAVLELMGVKAATNPLHHDRYSDAEAVAAAEASGKFHAKASPLALAPVETLPECVPARQGQIFFLGATKSFHGCNGEEMFQLAGPRDGRTRSSAASSCAEIRRGGVTESGTYWVNRLDGEAIRVWCDMAHDGGGWMLLANYRTGHYRTSFRVGRSQITSASGGSDAPSDWYPSEGQYGHLALTSFPIQGRELQLSCGPLENPTLNRYASSTLFQNWVGGDKGTYGTAGNPGWGHLAGVDVGGRRHTHYICGSIAGGDTFDGIAYCSGPGASGSWSNHRASYSSWSTGGVVGCAGAESQALQVWIR